MDDRKFIKWCIISLAVIGVLFGAAVIYVGYAWSRPDPQYAKYDFSEEDTALVTETLGLPQSTQVKELFYAWAWQDPSLYVTFAVKDDEQWQTFLAENFKLHPYDPTENVGNESREEVICDKTYYSCAVFFHSAPDTRYTRLEVYVAEDGETVYRYRIDRGVDGSALEQLVSKRKYKIN